jgi:transcriptional regulator with XRE-family HTH domain
MSNTENKSPTRVKGDSEGIRIGRQIRDLRRAKGVTLQTMADKIDRSVGYVSQVERGVSILPVPVLQSICELLEVQVTWFFHTEARQPLEELGHIVRANARRHLDFSGTGIHEELLSPTLSGEMLMILTTFGPGAESSPEQRKRRGEEGGYIKSGSLTLSIGDEVFELVSGDSFTIRKEDRYLIKNPSTDSEASIVWVICPPSY